VNSNIIINKIFLELRIPDTLIFSHFQEKNTQNSSKSFMHKHGLNIDFHKHNDILRRNISPRIHPSLVIFNHPLLQYNIHPQVFDFKQMAMMDHIHRVKLSNMTNPLFHNGHYPIHANKNNYVQSQHNKNHSNIVNANQLKKLQFIQMLMNFYEGQCNFFIFIKAVKPYIHRSNTECFVIKVLTLDEK